MEKKLLIINTKQFGYVAGYHYYAKYLKEEYKIRYICFDHNMPKVNADGIEVCYLKLPRLRFLRLLYFVFKVVLDIYKNKYAAEFMVYHKLAWLVKLFCPFSNMILDIRTGDLNKRHFIRKLFNIYIYFNVLFFRKVTILSESLRKVLRLPAGKCTIMPLGAEPFPVERNYDSMNLFYVGTLNMRDIHHTVKGFASFYKEYKNKIDMSYDIVGYGSEKEETVLTETIKMEGMEEVVVFHGRKNHDELYPFLKKCNIGVSYVPVTPFFDIQPPTKTFEYVLSGMICIATDTLENRRCINEKNGVLCDSNPEAFCQALVELADKRHKYNSEEIAASLKSNSWSEIVKNILKPVLL